MHIDLPKKLYYSIGEVAKAFGVKNSLIRFWDKEFDILKPKKMQKGTGVLPAMTSETSS